MGARSCIGVVYPGSDAGQVQITYDHWMANHLPCELLPGPGYATRRAQAGMPMDDWLDTVWAEGDALIDYPRRTLLFHGGELTNYSKGSRLAVLRMLGGTWPGWTVRWCHEELLDIVDYLGGDRAAHLVGEHPWDPGHWWEPSEGDLTRPRGPGDEFEGVGVLTLRDGDRTVERMVNTHWEFLTVGPEVLRQAFRRGPFPLQDPCRAESGAYADYGARVLTAWSVWPAPGIREALAVAWPGWSVRYTYDDPGEHERAAGVALANPDMVPDEGKHAHYLEFAHRMLSQGEPYDVGGLLQRLDSVGVSLEAQPAAFETTVAGESDRDLALRVLVELWRRWVPGRPCPYAG